LPPQPNPESVRLVCLIGFMGAGKTSVGRELARQLQCTFTDLDEAIEAFERTTIGEIFSRSGQAAFRHSETETLKRILEQHADEALLILAAGGGTYVKKENQEVLQSARAAVVFLSAPVDELWQRVSSQVGVVRPMMRDRATFAALLESRLAHFQQAPWVIDTSGRGVPEIVKEIRSRLGL
jgi:shikimate kinase